MPIVAPLSVESTRGPRPDLSATVRALLDEHAELYEELQDLLRRSSSSSESAHGNNPTEQIQRAEALRKKLDANISLQGATHYIDSYNTAIETFKLPLSYHFATTTGEVDVGLFALREKALRTVQNSEGRWWKEFSTPNVSIQAFCDVKWRPQAGINLYQGCVSDVVYRTKDPGQLNWLDNSHIHVVHGWKDRHTQLMDDSWAESR